MKKKNVFLILCVMFGFYACQSVDEHPSTDVQPPQASVDEPDLTLIPREDIVLTRSEQAVVLGNNTFAFDLLRRVAGEEPESNLLVSPLSLSLALAMLNNGAAGLT